MMAATIAIAAVIPTLAVNHGLRKDAILSRLIADSPTLMAGTVVPGVARNARSESRN